MYNVGVFGHRAGDWHIEPDILKSRIRNVIDVLRFQYGRELILNVDGESGAGVEVIDLAIELKVKYNMFLVSSPEFNKVFYENENEKAMAKRLEAQYNNSYGITIRSSMYNKSFEIDRDRLLIDGSSFLICFWEEKKQGRTFDMIKYSLATNKLVLNGLSDLKMISNIDLKKRRRQ